MVMNLESLLDIDVPLSIGIDDKFVHLLITFDGMRDVSSTKQIIHIFLYSVFFVGQVFVTFE